MMITLEELNPRKFKLNEDQEKNLMVLFVRMNEVRTAWGKPMLVTSGVRTPELQAELIAKGVSCAPKSKHLTGEACDIKDKDGALAFWIKSNLPLMGSIGLWFEDFNSTKGWVHFQTCPPKSGLRVFKP